MKRFLPQHHLLQGVVFMIFSVWLYSVNDVLFKWLGSGYHPLEVIFFRSLFSFLPLLFYFSKKESFKQLRTSIPSVHIIRSILSYISLLLFVYAFTELPIADAYSVIFIGPLCAALFSGYVLREWVNKPAAIATLIGFATILAMMQPGEEVFSLGGGAAFLAAIIRAFTLTLSRFLSRTETTCCIQVWCTTIFILISCCWIPFVWFPPSWVDLGLFMCLGLVGGIGQIAITEAFRHAPSYIISPLYYLTIVFGGIMGYLIWADIPDTLNLIGASVLILCGLYVTYEGRKESRHGRADL